MSAFENQGLRDGVWSGVLTASKEPQRVYLVYLGQTVGLARIAAAGKGKWQVDCDIPPQFLNDGIQIFQLVTDSGTETDAPLPEAEVLAKFAMQAGAPVNQDLVTEVELIRAELELLKREIRRLATLG